jgi:GAF domain-containing protein
MVPLIVRDAGIGELWLGSVNQDYFDLGDMQMVSTAAGQLAGVVEQSYLSSQTDESLRRRVEQLTAIMQITRELSTSLDLHSLLQLVYDQAILTTRADCGRIVLLEWSRGGETRLKPGFCVGDSNKSQLSPLELEVLESGEVNYVPDVYQSSLQEQVQALENSSSMVVGELQFVHEQLPALKKKEQEQNETVDHLTRQVRQLRAGLEAAVFSSQSSSTHDLLQTIAQEIMVRFEMDAALVAELTLEGPRLIYMMGVLPENARLEALFGQRNPLRQILEDGRLVLKSDSATDADWQNNPFLGAMSARSLIGLPLVIDAQHK